MIAAGLFLTITEVTHKADFVWGQFLLALVLQTFRQVFSFRQKPRSLLSNHLVVNFTVINSTTYTNRKYLPVVIAWARNWLTSMYFYIVTVLLESVRVLHSTNGLGPLETAMQLTNGGNLAFSKSNKFEIK